VPVNEGRFPIRSDIRYRCDGIQFELSKEPTMSFSRIRIALLSVLTCSVVTFMYPSNWSGVLTSARPQPEAEIAGMIAMRNGEVMNVKTAEGKIVEVALNPDTKIDEPQSVFGFRKKRLDVTALEPGLGVVVRGLQYENELLVASTITLSQVGPNSALAAPSRGPQVTNLADYSVKATYFAHFEAGSALLSQTDKAGLMGLANSANSAGGHSSIIQVQGFADFPGHNAYDQQLSRDRAEAVIDYLEQAGRVPITHIVAPGVLKEGAPAAANEPVGGNAENRRAEVRLLLKN
jgi:outer membrane protein OmpA-like peptidoglycan-associated protein